MKRLLAVFLITGGIAIFLVSGLIFFENYKVVLDNPKSTSPTKDVIEHPTKEVLAILQEANNKNEQAKKLLSNEHSTQEDQTTAKKLLKESLDEAILATQKQPKSPETWYFLSLIYRELADINPKALPFAEDALKKAISLNPNNAKLYPELASIDVKEQKYQDAEVALQTAIKLDPKDPSSYIRLGNLYKEMGQKEKARNFYLEAKNRTPKNDTDKNAMIDFQLKSLE